MQAYDPKRLAAPRAGPSEAGGVCVSWLAPLSQEEEDLDSPASLALQHPRRGPGPFGTRGFEAPPLLVLMNLSQC